MNDETTKPARPVVFLDIDGVLVVKAFAHVRAPQRRLPGDPRAPMVEVLLSDAVTALNRLCTEAGAAIVVSSFRRTDDGLRDELRAAGVTAPFHADWRTDFHGPRREDEIRRWLFRHGYPPFVILDDWPDDLAHISNVVLTDFRTGLRDADRVRAAAVLQIQMLHRSAMAALPNWGQLPTPNATIDPEVTR